MEFEHAEFEQIKRKIEQLKTQCDRAEGSLDTIRKTWKETYGISSCEEAFIFCEQKKQEIEEAEKELSSLWKDLKEVTNWKEL